MSYLESGEGRFRWTVALAGTSIRKTVGCVQCGSRLESSPTDPHNHSGKCFNCQSWISEDDETFEELDD
jgi:hypothetical protein